MKISILDFGGNFAGPALGFHLLGHRVSYFQPGEVLPPLRGLAVSAPTFDADLVIYAASFADEAWALEVGIQLDGPFAPQDPFLPSINPRQREVRERYLEPLLARSRHLVMVDMSDVGEVIDARFSGTGQTHFKRELPLHESSSHVQPFPFLYHPALLAVEFQGRLTEHLVPPESRPARAEFLFAGNLNHWRYFGRRQQLLAGFRRRHPHVPVRVIAGGMTARGVWQELQRARAGIYLPGRGALCFRLHELAALGVPAVATEELAIRVPPLWRKVLPTSPKGMMTPSAMLAFYARHYHPIHAARWLLERTTCPPAVQREPADCTR